MIHNKAYGGGRYKTTHTVEDRNARYLAQPWWETLFNTTAIKAAAACAGTLGIPFHSVRRMIEELSKDRKAMDAYRAFMQESSCRFMEGYISSERVGRT